MCASHKYSIALVHSSPAIADIPLPRIIRAKCGKFLELRTSEIASAGFSGTKHQTLVQWSPGLLDLFHCPCSESVQEKVAIK